MKAAALMLALLLLGFIFVSGGGRSHFTTTYSGYHYGYYQPAFVGSVLHPATFYGSSVWVTRPAYPSYYGYRAYRYW